MTSEPENDLLFSSPDDAPLSDDGAVDDASRDGYRADGSERNRVEPGALYLVATPIGNMADVSDRCRKVLAGVDFVAAEDTRNSGLFLSRLGIRRPLVSYHEHNKASRGPELIRRMQEGESCALISDAGTPAVSDPGEDLVRLCAEAGLPVHPVPGACAGICALTVSALSTRRFVFEGFLPVSGKERRERLEALSREERTAVIYEAPHRLKKTLAELCEVCGNERRIALCRELTKLNEEVRRCTLSECAAYYERNDPRGEYVLILDGAEAAAADGVFWAGLSVKEHVEHYVISGLSHKDAIKSCARDRGVPKSEIYAIMVKDRENSEEE